MLSFAPLASIDAYGVQWLILKWMFKEELAGGNNFFKIFIIFFALVCPITVEHCETFLTTLPAAYL